MAGEILGGKCASISGGRVMLSWLLSFFFYLHPASLWRGDFIYLSKALRA